MVRVKTRPPRRTVTVRVSIVLVRGGEVSKTGGLLLLLVDLESVAVGEFFECYHRIPEHYFVKIDEILGILFVEESHESVLEGGEGLLVGDVAHPHISESLEEVKKVVLGSIYRDVPYVDLLVELRRVVGQLLLAVQEGGNLDDGGTYPRSFDMENGVVSVVVGGFDHEEALHRFGFLSVYLDCKALSCKEADDILLPHFTGDRADIHVICFSLVVHRGLRFYICFGL